MIMIVQRVWAQVKRFLPTRQIGDWLPPRQRMLLRIRLDNFHKHPPILVYTMGKVGTTTLTSSLSELGIPNAVHHIHFLTHDGIARMKAQYAARGRLKSRRADHVLRSEALLRRLEDDPFTCWVITGVRDPVARRISEVFQNADWYHTDLLDAEGAISVPRTVQFLRNEFDQMPSDAVFSWFNQELRPAFGIDVFGHAFDQARGYTLIEGERARVLVFCLESLNDRFGQAIAEFLDMDHVPRMIKENRSLEKAYHESYEQVKAVLTLSETTLNRIYDSPAVRHFYSPSHIEAFKARWREPAAG